MVYILECLKDSRREELQLVVIEIQYLQRSKGMDSVALIGAEMQLLERSSVGVLLSPNSIQHAI
eukprot:1031346-Amorphochlora_amoeboformis.AAC.1